MATDFTIIGSNGGFFSTGVSGLLQQTSNNIGGVQTIFDSAGKAAEFGIVHDNNAFFGFLDWLQQNNIAKILAEPNIVAVSGRPAQFNVGGEIPIVVPQSLGTASIEFKPFGTQVDFLPIVLGNGNIRLEVRPRISEIDDSRSVIIQDFVIPALTVRQVDTAVEMKASQTFAIAGLVQERTEAISRGLPYVSDLPVIGLPFRGVEEEVNEIELLILVTPEFVDPIDGCEVPHGGPGYFTTSPSNHDLYCKGHLEVPNHCNPIRGLSACGEDPCGPGAGCGCNNGCGYGNPNSVITDGMSMPGGVGYDESYGPTMATPESNSVAVPMENGGDATDPARPSSATPHDLPIPSESQPPATTPQPDNSGLGWPEGGLSSQPVGAGGLPQDTGPRPYSPTRQPVFLRNVTKPNNPSSAAAGAAPGAGGTGLIGPVGYDVE
jgi:pilus assembly protein CpaC